MWKVLDGALSARIARSEAALTAAEKNAGTSFQARGPVRSYASEDAMYRELVAMWARSSLQMHALCQGLGIEYVHFLQPNQYLAGSKPMGDEERRTALKPDSPYRRAVETAYPMLSAAGAELRRSGVAFFDLSQVYSTVEKPLYVDTCCHVSYEGYRLIAVAVAEALAEGPFQGGKGKADRAYP